MDAFHKLTSQHSSCLRNPGDRRVTRQPSLVQDLSPTLLLAMRVDREIKQSQKLNYELIKIETSCFDFLFFLTRTSR